MAPGVEHADGTAAVAPLGVGDRLITAVGGANRHAVVRGGLLPVGEGTVGQLGATAVGVALRCQGSFGLPPPGAHQRLQIGHRSTFTGRLRGGDRLACDQAADQGTHRRAQQGAGVSLLGCIVEADIGILDLVETHREPAGFAIVPAEDLMIRLSLVLHVADTGVGLHAQGLHAWAREVEIRSVIELDDVGIGVACLFVLEGAVPIEGFVATAHQLATALGPDQHFGHGRWGEGGGKPRQKKARAEGCRGLTKATNHS